MGIYRRGKVYWGRWVEDGKLHRRSLKTSKRAEALRRFDEMSGEAHPPIPPKGVVSHPSEKPLKTMKIREILKLWFEHQTVRCKPLSLDVYRNVKKRFSIVWGDLAPENLNLMVVDEFQHSALQVGLGAKTINHQIGIVFSAIKWAHERELIDTGPPTWKRLKEQNATVRKYLTGEEISQLLKTCRQPRFQRLEVVIMLGLYAGLRRQEIMWLTWDDVDLEEGWLDVRSKPGWSPKSASSERSIPIADELATFLRDSPRMCSTWVAPQAPGKQWCSRFFGNQTQKLFETSGVNDGSHHTLHRLRGTFATTVLRAGGDLESLRDLLGHTLLSVTAGYLTSTSESKRRAVKGVSFGS